MCKYGYCRISRAKQSIERQIRNIKDRFPDAVIIQEVFTRTTLERKEWQKLIKAVKEGDTIIFDSVSRMSGNSADGFLAYETLYSQGVNLVFLKEPHIDTAVYKKALENNKLPVSIDYTAEEITEGVLKDKKRRGGEISFVFPEKIGHCEIVKVPVAEVTKLIEKALK